MWQWMENVSCQHEAIEFDWAWDDVKEARERLIDGTWRWEEIEWNGEAKREWINADLLDVDDFTLFSFQFDFIDACNDER